MPDFLSGTIDVLRRSRAAADSHIPFLYQPIEHPELASWPAQQPCRERLDMILEDLKGKTGSLIDIGCHTGWFCRAFARLGWDVLGVDRSPEWIETARALNPLCETNQPWYWMFDIVEHWIPRADVALCLSVAMYPFQAGVETGWNFLRRVSLASPVMYFDFGGQYAVHLPFNKESAIAEILARTDYTEGAFLGFSEINRPLYRFSR